MWNHKPVRAVITGVFSVVILVLVALSITEENRNVGRMVGVRVQQVDGGIEVTAVGAGLPAAKAGLITDDLLIAIDGKQVATLADYDQHAINFNKSDPVQFTILRNGSEKYMIVRPGVPFRWVGFLSSKITVLLYLGLALVVLGSSATDIRARLLFMFSIAVALELSIPEAAFGPAGWTAIAGLFFLVVSGFQMGVELHLASVIPERQPWVARRPWVIPAYHVAGIGFGVMAGLAFVADVFQIQIFPWNSDQLAYVLSTVLLPFWSTAVVVLLGWESLRNPDPQGRQQAGLVLVGVLPWTILTVTTTFIPGALAFLAWYADPLQSIVLVFYPIAVFFAIFKYQLFDIELVVRRGLVYTSLTIILVTLFYVFVASGGTLLAMVISDASSVWVVSAATLILGLLFSPLRDAVRSTVDRRFFPERYALRQRLIALAEELPELRKLPVMGAYLASRLTEIFDVSSVTLLIGDPETGVMSVLSSTQEDESKNNEQGLLVALDDPGIEALRGFARPTVVANLYPKSQVLESRLRALDTTLVVPVLSRANLIGMFLIGKRRGTERFPSEELELLSLLSHHVATTFENARLFESATYEGLTGLLRRESIIEQLKSEISRAMRYKRPLTIGMADLDHFKAVNDRFGHLTGDATLQRIAQSIESGLRSTDAVGRYGGEEFLFVLPETCRDDASLVAEKVRKLVEGTVVSADDGSDVKVTISIGLASLEDLDQSLSIDTTDLIAVADSNLYRAKRAGRNRIEPVFETMGDS